MWVGQCGGVGEKGNWVRKAIIKSAPLLKT